MFARWALHFTWKPRKFDMELLKWDQNIVWKSDSRRKTDDVSTKGINWLNRSASSVHLELYLQTSIGKSCFVYVLFFVALQAQHNRGRGNLAISPILQGICQCWADKVARSQMGTRTLNLTSCCCSKKAVPLLRDSKSWWLGLEDPENAELVQSPVDWVLVAATPWAGLYSALCVCVCVRTPGHPGVMDTHCLGAASQLEGISAHAHKNFAGLAVCHQVDWQTLWQNDGVNNRKWYIFLGKCIVFKYHKQVNPLRCFTVTVQNRFFWL